MVTVNINLYEFNELGEEAQNEAISNQMGFLNLDDFGLEDDEEPSELDYDNDEDRKIVIENILANAYLFYKNGSLASCTTYTGKHEKAGITEFRLGGETYNTIIGKMEKSIVKQVRETFRDKYLHVDMNGISDELIIDFWKKPYILNTNTFSDKCYCLYDYIIANDLTHITQ